MKSKKANQKRKAREKQAAAASPKMNKTIKNWDKPTGIGDFAVTKREKKRRKLRMERFAGGETSSDDCCDDEVGVADDEIGLYAALSSSRTPLAASEKAAASTAATGKVVGTSTKLEKSYLRLTTYPKPQDIRPLSVLQKALEHIKTRYNRDEHFEWANEQLKSVRQDMTVQGINCTFCLDVYETHARILLEQGDLNEFNQCQSMIRSLTKQRKPDGAASATSEPWDSPDVLLKQTEEHKDEFDAYQLLYSTIQNNGADLNRALGDATLTGHSCQHAVSVVKAVIQNDYHTFFRLYDSASHLSAYLMDFLVKRVRKNAYDRIVASYRPTIGVEYFREALQFPNLDETREFLNKNGAVFVEDSESEFWIDCKESMPNR